MSNDLVIDLRNGWLRGEAEGMEDRRSQRRAGATQAALLLAAAAGLGLVAPPPASASCAGPQVTLEQGGAPITARRVGEGESERLLHDVIREQPLRVNGSNLTFGCSDTFAPRGCGSPVPEPTEPIVPLEDAQLVLTQRERSWTLARVGVIGPDLTTVLDVTLPRGLRSGPATLALIDQHEGAARSSSW